MDRHSLRWRLLLSYAAIALLTVLALGAVLIVTLQGYYRGQEQRYLEGNAAEISLVAAQLLEAGAPQALLQDQANNWSFFFQARVQLLDARARLLADSGVPQARQVLMMSAPVAGDVFVQAVDAPAVAGMVQPAVPAEMALSVGLSPTATLPARQVFVFSQGQALPGLPVPAAGDILTGTVTITATGPGGLCQPDAPGCGPVLIRIERAPGGEGVIVPFTDTVTAGLGLETAPVAVAMPLEDSLYGFNLKLEPGPGPQRSGQVIDWPVTGRDGRPLGLVRLSDGPAYGAEIVDSVVRGWLVAGLAAVLLAALVGWLASRRFTAPLLALGQATERMAAGDLAARAAVTGRDEFGRLAGSFNAMAGRVEDMVGTLRSFVSDAAHELHTPLTALRTYLELAGDERDPAQQTAHLAAAGAQAARLQEVIDGLLDLSRLEGVRPAHAPVDLAALALAAVEGIASRCEQLGLDLDLQLPVEPVWVLGDAQQLRLALDNLLDNAAKFTPPGGQVRVRLSAAEGWAALQVADTGMGVPPEDLPRLFQRFHRGRNAAAYPGSGLGLAIVRSVAEAHRGTVTVQSLAGTEFVLSIPLE